MKSYKDVVKDRYDNEKYIHLYDNVYSLINPTGFYINYKMRYVLYKIFNKIRKSGIDITRSKILDIGCGDGIWTRFFAELKGTTKDIYGIDLSKNRIKKAKMLNPNIKYLTGDIIDINLKNIKFDIVIAMDLFSYFNTEVQIIKSLDNIYNLLKKNGLFFLYDIYNKSHFKRKKNSDTHGFNNKEIIEFSEKAGFEKIYYSKIFKKILWKYHSAYAVNNFFSFEFISLLEKILPGTAGNIFFLFKKE